MSMNDMKGRRKQQDTFLNRSFNWRVEIKPKIDIKFRKIIYHNKTHDLIGGHDFPSLEMNLQMKVPKNLLLTQNSRSCVKIFLYVEYLYCYLRRLQETCIFIKL